MLDFDYICNNQIFKILTKKIIIEELKKQFKGKEYFSREDLFAFYRQFEPDLKETTFRWRIYHLKEKKLITPLSKNLFSFTYKPLYKPGVSEFEQKLFSRLEKQFHGLRLCIWSTKILDEFVLHMPKRFMVILEVEKEAIEHVFHFLKDINTRNVYLAPNQKEIERYINEANTGMGAVEMHPPIILQTLVTKSPLQKVGKTTTATVEKILVDLFCEKDLFSTFQGSELAFIIYAVHSKYAIDFTKLFSYAERRRKKTELMDYLSAKTDISKQIWND